VRTLLAASNGGPPQPTVGYPLNGWPRRPHDEARNAEKRVFTFGDISSPLSR
jgi:hypothetical protein